MSSQVYITVPGFGLLNQLFLGLIFGTKEREQRSKGKTAKSSDVIIIQLWPNLAGPRLKSIKFVLASTNSV